VSIAVRMLVVPSPKSNPQDMSIPDKNLALPCRLRTNASRSNESD
jgi:hypothetical protein